MKLFRSPTTSSTLHRTNVFFKTSLFYATTTTVKNNTLYRRISPIGDPKLSIVPVLDQWVKEGRSVDSDELRKMIKELKGYKRFKHALEMSMWMSEKRYIPLSTRDVAVRLDLIGKVHGMEQAEKYFNSISKQLKCMEVYSALLNCYAHGKSVEKAEALMQLMRDSDFSLSTVSYNVMLNLYYKTKEFGKLDALMREMDERRVPFDNYTLGIRLSAYAATSDIKGLESTAKRMESDPRIVMDWLSYAVLASGFLKAGLTDRGLLMLKKCEKLILKAQDRGSAFNYLLSEYTAAGKKEEVLRVWELYKKNKIYNKGYLSIIHSLLKFDDVENAEKIFQEWESQDLAYDARIPNLLISEYCKRGLLDKAEGIISRGISKGGHPDALTWYHMGTGFIKNKQYDKAVEALRKAILNCQPGWKPTKDVLTTCINFVKMNQEVEKAKEFIRLLGDKKVVSVDVQERLLKFVEDESIVPVEWDMEGDA